MLIDGNIIIYAGQRGHEFLHPLIAGRDSAVSVITLVEVLGYHRLLPLEKEFLTELFNNMEILPLSEQVVMSAISLRQTRSIKLADSLIAGTAIAHGIPLVTRNAPDFDWIPGLALINPFDSPN